ncbi:hypothetical protein A3C09_04440 [Candidatus Uhrbacteria bacterium RIFCSPHIGHO2_02_FULL_47_44]|uniref:Uncharacterized protein n=1 Tax=Candidatus Uhrbacteria bacterium RIFCSPLOWO2_02_FULL_48_18 TaxID=1802408 RepID=A0A1F7VC96_9BACT|nr:MAG: hypothetical protein A2839_02150 [Candidatus Uhrbacteria bacterium RIFCSPHIGHO2_01_FULL_47_10]OGL70154.1 MAG: hypothetical protein A3C09_04440 [Candidatus Uhrbacteria bacterium RIFCSPHIGHO2_02_FULL_47_44]OGL77835.1 MAG: hypothetical protein A3E97_02660 [Candidatus Uhrbacteria bacterium RIFCSPHIGHO2_12_FULL_47_12]OGL80655.1 MAG: hypothetical protein A3B20_04655 [Candidatus Uhrbacteria bacterium RIFCSPLOWO2_01_FULL_47_17]OGL88162.1 MAG: hypothetical protein A3I41_00325 [Candidatus Uhrbact
MKQDIDLIWFMVFFLFCSMMCNTSNDSLERKIDDTRTEMNQKLGETQKLSAAVQAQTEAINRLNQTLQERLPAR